MFIQLGISCSWATLFFFVQLSLSHTNSSSLSLNTNQISKSNKGHIHRDTLAFGMAKSNANSSTSEAIKSNMQSRSSATEEIKGEWANFIRLKWEI